MEPRSLLFVEQGKERKKELKIVNTGGCRMAWRILSNAPWVYLVNPNKGFISDKETALIEVTLIDSSKHTSRHQFLLEMKKADKEEVDREEIWEREDERIVSHLRVTTRLEPDPNNKTRPSNSTTSLASPSPATTRTTGSSESTPTLTAISPANPEAHREFLDEIRALDVEVQKALDEKANRSKELTKAVNDVKMLEQELDKETNRMFEVSRRNAHLSSEIAAIKKKGADVQNP